MGKKPSSGQVVAARRVDDLFIRNKGDARYMRNLTGEGAGPVDRSVRSVPSQGKVANAQAIVRAADRKAYLEEISRRRGKP